MKALVCETQRMVPVGTIGPALEEAEIELVTWPADSDGAPALEGYSALLVLGGAASPLDRDPWLEGLRGVVREAFAGGMPVLGLCLGAQLLAQCAGARVHRLQRPEIGWLTLEATRGGRRDPIYQALDHRHEVFEWHEFGFELPSGAELLAGTVRQAQAFRLGRRAWGFQFHLEADERIIADWIAHYDRELRREGIDPRQLARQTAGRIPSQTRSAAGLAAGFARVVEDHETERARERRHAA